MARSYTHFGAQRLLCVALALVLLSSLPTRAFTPAYAQTTLRIFTSGVRLPVAGAQIGNWFGGPIATNGDGTVLVIGAPYRMFGQPGAAYVFVRATTADTFTHVATLHASDGADRDCFSSSVALSADGTTIVIGRVAIGPLGYIGTTAYLFVRPPTGWVHATETAQLTATALAPGDAFGWSIAVSANGGTVAISASSDNSGLGAVYMYTRPIQGWSSSTQTGQLSATSDAGQLGA